MDEKTDKPGEQASVSPEDDKLEQPEYRELSEEELQILEEHKKWVESDGKEGEMAEIVEADLQNANLYKANLQGANLEGANLEGANLEGANLEGANLEGANLEEANLQNAFLEEANLQKVGCYRANLQGAKLMGANLQEAILVEANLRNAKLQSAKLKNAQIPNADLRGANLTGAILKNANLGKTNLEGADLTYADIAGAYFGYSKLNCVKFINTQGINEAIFGHANLKDTIGFLGNEFAQADVTGTKLPDEIKEFKVLDVVEKTSQNARKIFFAILLGCVYSWLTIATTTDVRLLTNTASSPLPIIGTQIPIAWFYIAAPLVLICIYLYFHFYLQGLWEGLVGLPAIFPDGKRLDERAYPWLLNRLVRRHFMRLKTNRPIMSHLQEYVVIMLTWWVIPITMMAFWLRYIPRHEWIGTCLHIFLIVVSVASAIMFYRICALTLKGQQKVTFKFIKYGIVLLIVGVFCLIFSYIAIDEMISADFREKIVSEIPANYWEIKDVERIKSVKGADLKGRNLKNADMYKAFLVKADLRETKLQKANLKGANLQGANLGGAILQEANLIEANLEETNLIEANLQGANLIRANLLKADLKGANLSSANLQESNLRFANLKKANLKGAKLQKARNFGVKRLCATATLHEAELDIELEKQIKEKCPHLFEDLYKKKFK